MTIVIRLSEHCGSSAEFGRLAGQHTGEELLGQREGRALRRSAEDKGQEN